MKKRIYPSIFCGLALGLIFVVAYCFGIYDSIQLIINNVDNTRILAYEIINIIFTGASLIIAILYSIQTMIKNNLTYNYRGALLLTLCYLATSCILGVTRYFISDLSWDNANSYLIPGIILGLFAFGYFMLMASNNRIQSGRVAFLLTIFAFLHIFTMMMINLKTLSWSGISEQAVLMGAQVLTGFITIWVKDYPKNTDVNK